MCKYFPSVMFVFLFTCGSLCFAGDQASIDAWQKWRQQIDSWQLVSEEMSSEGDSTNSRTIASDANHLAVVVRYMAKKQSGEIANIINPDYAAELQRMIDGEWVLKRLVLSTDNNYRDVCSELRQADYFEASFINAARVLTTVVDGSFESHPSADGRTCLISGVHGLNSNLPEFETAVELVAHENGQGCPFSISFNSTPETEVAFVWPETITVAGITVASQSQVWVNSKPRPDGKPATSHQFSLIKINEKIDVDLCRLTAFGLPEPAGIPSRSNWLVWLCCILGIGGAFLVWKRATQ